MPVVKPIHARVGEIVEIHWHRTDPPERDADPKARTWVLRERHTAPPVATWDAREPAPLDWDALEDADDDRADPALVVLSRRQRQARPAWSST